MKVMSEDQVLAAMSAVEEETIRRCAEIARAYAGTKGVTRTIHSPSSRIAAAKMMAAKEVADLIEKLPRKDVK